VADSSLRAVVKLTEHVTFSVRAGLKVGGELELRDGNNNAIATEDLNSAPFGAVNLRYNF